MLGQILDYIHNYFVKQKFNGKFKIENHELVLEDAILLENQYYIIKGSIFNDGLYQYGVSELTDEVFEGEIWALAIPVAVIQLADDITDWLAEYGQIADSPYNSESFGGYSYTKSNNGNGGSNDNSTSWQSVFRNRLNAYRKIS